RSARGRVPRCLLLDDGDRALKDAKCPLLAHSGHKVVRCTCPLLTQSGHGTFLLVSINRAFPFSAIDPWTVVHQNRGGGGTKSQSRSRDWTSASILIWPRPGKDHSMKANVLCNPLLPFARRCIGASTVLGVLLAVPAFAADTVNGQVVGAWAPIVGST